MLIEWLEALATPAAPGVRRLGYVRESVLLSSRARRCRRAWAAHQAATRTAILDAAAGLSGRAVVLGSGPLGDVPLAALAASFARVDLVDVVHPWRARRAARRHRNVVPVLADLTGGRWREGETAAGTETVRALCAGTDLVVSASVLSQLPIVPVDWFEARRLAVPPRLAADIVAAHLAALDGLAARVCLVTDVEQVEEDRAGVETDRTDLLHGVALPPADRAWDWDLAPFGEASRRRRLVHRVQAYPDWAAARRGIQPDGAGTAPSYSTGEVLSAACASPPSGAS